MAMNKIILTLVWLLSLLTFVHAKDLPIISKRDFFGIYLGEEITNVIKRASEKGIDIKQTSQDELPEYSFTGAINTNAAVKETKFWIYKGRIVQIRIFFRNISFENYTDIKQVLGKKYPKIPDAEVQKWKQEWELKSEPTFPDSSSHLSGDDFSPNSFNMADPNTTFFLTNTKIDNQMISICLTLMRNSVLYVDYKHDCVDIIRQEDLRLLKEHKMKSVSDNL